MELERDKQMGRNILRSFLRLFPLQMHSKAKIRQHSLLVFDGVVTGIAHPDLELEAHDRVA